MSTSESPIRILKVAQAALPQTGQMQKDPSIAVCWRCAKFECDEPNGKQGICRAHPPQTVLVGHIPGATSISHPQPVVQAFPTPVSRTGWCWEFIALTSPPQPNADNLLRIPADDDAA